MLLETVLTETLTGASSATKSYFSEEEVLTTDSSIATCCFSFSSFAIASYSSSIVIFLVCDLPNLSIVVMVRFEEEILPDKV